MPKFTTETEYETVVKEYDIKKHYKNIDALDYVIQDGKLSTTLLETGKLAYELVESIDKIIIIKPEEIDIFKGGFGGGSFGELKGCMLIDFKNVSPATEKDRLLICSKELNDKISESKLNKLVDKITYP